MEFARHNAVALVALFVALGGTGYAAVKINGRDIKKGTIRGSALKHHTLTAKQINVSKLGQVPSAKTAAFATVAATASSATTASTASTASDANELGGVPASGFLQSGCGPGRVEGYARIVGLEPGFPKTYTSSSTFVHDTFNCTGQPVEVRRASTGTYFIRFDGNPGTLGFGNWAACVPGKILCLAVDDRNVAVTHVGTGTDTGSFQVLVQDTTNSAPQDDVVDVLIP